MKTGRAIQLALLLLLTLPGSASPAEITATSNATGKVVSGNSQLALNLYQQIRAERGNGNIFFSPAAITTAFALLYPGAKGHGCWRL